MPMERSIANCRLCVVRAINSYVKGEDTLDVWFDSGASWAATWAGRDVQHNTGTAAASGFDSSLGLGSPADVVLEGSDQHRYDFEQLSFNIG